MSLQKYAALLKTVELGSISLAAEQMGYTQPAVSRMIADLEKEWQVELLRRSRAGLEPSSVCLQLLPAIRAIQADRDALDFTLAEFHEAHTGLIRVGLFTSVADMWMPKLLKSFQKLYPNISFELNNMENYVAIENSIRRGKVDCGFIRLPAPNDLQSHFLMEDELVAVLHPDHPLAKETVFPIEKLRDEIFIQLREKTDFEVSNFLDRLPHRPKQCYEVGSDHTLLSMVEAGLGISITHALIAENPRYRVVCKRFDMRQRREIAIATAKNVRLASTTKLFIDHVTSSIAAHSL